MDPSLQLYERIPNKFVKHQDGFNPSTYKSIQDRVNEDPAFEEQYISQLIEDGWVKLKNNSSILYYPAGSSFKYRLNGNSISKIDAGTFRSGGFLIGPPPDSKEYILYKAFNGCIFPLQIKDIDEVYVKDITQKIVKFNRPTKEPTNNVAYLPHPTTKELIPVYYGDKPKDVKRFTSSQKFQTALKYNKWTFR